MKIKKRNFIRIISFLSAIALIFGGYALKINAQRLTLADRMELEYRQSLSEFSSLISEINDSLKKQFYSSSPEMLAILSNDIYKNTSAAKECLERLPVSLSSTENIYKFLSTAGDFARAVAVSDGEEVIRQNREQLKKLIAFSEKLSSKIGEISSELEESDSLSEDVNNVMNKLDEQTSFSTSSEDLSEIALAIPTLIYDGPFSDHVISKKAKLLETAGEISLESAKEKACFYANDENLTYVCDEQSNTESFIFENGDNVCAVTKKGGYCLYMNKQPSKKEQKIDENTAISVAKKYLNKIFGLEFLESYYILSEGVLTINFAFYENGIIHYSDLVKVGVDINSADVVSIEARGFIMNHHSRDKYVYKNTQKSARAVLSDELKVVSFAKAMITDDALNEIYCYEFTCKATDGADVLVYVNDKTLVEEEIFLIEHVEGGTLVE